MDQRSFQRLLRRTVALPVILLVLLAITLTAEIIVLSASLRWVDHSDQVISAARQLQRQIVQMDTDLRGYHLTGDQGFLDSYNEAKSRVPEQFRQLHSLTADNPGQLQRIGRIENLDLQWMSWADQQISRGHKTSPSA